MFRYVSNAGIIMNLDNMNIGIDCLCKDTTKLYPDTPEEIRQELNLDALIVTHEHEDHFYAEYVKEAWKKNPSLQIYAGKKVIEELERLNIPSSTLNTVGDGDELQIGTLHIIFVESVHEGPQYADVQNLTILIEKEEYRYVVTGDAAPCQELFERIGVWSKAVDWFFLPFPYVGLRSTRRLLVDNLAIHNIFVLHQPRKEADVQNWVESAKRMCEKAKDGLPFPIFPEKLGSWHQI